MPGSGSDLHEHRSDDSSSSAEAPVPFRQRPADDHDDIHGPAPLNATQLCGSDSLLAATELVGEPPPGNVESAGSGKVAFQSASEAGSGLGGGVSFTPPEAARQSEGAFSSGAGPPVPQLGGAAAVRTVPSDVVVVLLATWASLATILCLWIWWRQPEPASPLENLPDDGVFQHEGKVVFPLEPLSQRYLIEVGRTKQFGVVALTPLAIECRPVRLLPDNYTTKPVLVLRLRLKNVSANQQFHPLDPAFLYPDPKRRLAGLPVFDRRGYTYTLLHAQAGTDRLILPFDLPFRQGFSIEDQEFPLLAPQEEAESIVISDEDAFDEIDGRMIWRVMIRRGLARSGKGVATVIGVVFDKSQVQVHRAG
jgi:hypothetical protein